MFQNSKKNDSKASARVVDGKLILALPAARNPVVWQMDLGQAKASALEVREHEGESLLVLKTPKGETVEIAIFAQRAQAVEGLMLSARALEDAQGQIRPQAGGGEGGYGALLPAKPRGRKKWLWGVLAVFVAFIFYLGFLIKNLPPQEPAADLAAAQAGDEPQSLHDSAGVPVSADAFLKEQ